MSKLNSSTGGTSLKPGWVPRYTAGAVIMEESGCRRDMSCVQRVPQHGSASKDELANYSTELSCGNDWAREDQEPMRMFVRTRSPRGRTDTESRCWVTG